MRVVVTGGSGFIGRQVVRTLRERGDAVSVIDLKPSSDPVAQVLEGDIADPEAVVRAIPSGTDAVVHLAAITSVLQSVNDPEGVFRTNVLGTELLIERCRDAGVGRFVFASTNAVVGDVGRSRINEQMVLRPLTPYGATKAAAEMLLSAYAASYGIVAVALRLTNVYGRGMQSKDSIIARLMRAALEGKGIQIYGDGEQVRDYVNVLDTVAAVDLALALDRHDVITIGVGESVSVNRLHEMVCEVTGVDVAAEHVAPKPGEMPAVIVDTGHAAELGFKPRFSIADGLVATWDDFRAAAGREVG